MQAFVSNNLSSVALVVIYNHQYIKNIEKIEALYQSKFQNIYHLMPFYTGTKSNVIPVFDNSFYFQGYIAQASNKLFSQNYKHCIFIGDDLLLNPHIDENNYQTYFKLDENSSFIPEFIDIYDLKKVWRQIDALRYCQKIKGVECDKFLPPSEVVLKKFQKQGLSVPKSFKLKYLYDFNFKNYLKLTHYLHTYFNIIVDNINIAFGKSKMYPDCKHFSTSYPITGGYSDIFIINNKSFKEFSNLCGIFAATNLFVELAIPTSILISNDNIITEKELNRQGGAIWVNKLSWTYNADKFEFLNKFDNNLSALIENFPDDYLYLHPIKFSIWK